MPQLQLELSISPIFLAPTTDKFWKKINHARSLFKNLAHSITRKLNPNRSPYPYILGLFVM